TPGDAEELTRPLRATSSSAAALSSAPQGQRYRAKKSLASLAGCKSLSGKGEPPTRSASCAHGGVARNARRTRWTRRRQSILEAVGGAASPEVLAQLRKGACGGCQGCSRTPKALQDHPCWRGWAGPPASSGRGRQEERRRRTWETPAAP